MRRKSRISSGAFSSFVILTRRCGSAMIYPMHTLYADNNNRIEAAASISICVIGRPDRMRTL